MAWLPVMATGGAATRQPHIAPPRLTEHRVRRLSNAIKTRHVISAVTTCVNQTRVEPFNLRSLTRMYCLMARDDSGAAWRDRFQSNVPLVNRRNKCRVDSWKATANAKQLGIARPSSWRAPEPAITSGMLASPDARFQPGRDDGSRIEVVNFGCRLRLKSFDPVNEFIKCILPKM
jgi:hypothetical protein